MGLKMNIESSQIQAKDVSNFAQQQIIAYEQLQTAIKSFVSDSEALKGEAYDSAKEYYNTVLLPLTTGAKLYLDTLQKAVLELPMAYCEQVDTKSWTEEQLIHYIHQEETKIAQLDELMQSFSKTNLVDEETAHLKNQSIQLLHGHYQNRDIYRTILNNLRSYDQYSNHLFDELKRIHEQLKIGLEQASGSWNPTTGRFSLPKNLQWAHYLVQHTSSNSTSRTSSKKTAMTTIWIEEFGFDQETADLLWKLYKNIQAKEGNNADYIFNRLIGGIIYDKMPNAKSYVKVFFWANTAGEAIDYSKYGVNKSFFSKIETAVTAQYSAPNSNNDFAHQSITTATILYRAKNLRLSNFAGIFNNYGYSPQFVNQLSGWRGDVTGQAFAKPSMNNGDYKADLDAVNITCLMNKQNLDYQTASKLYYEAIHNGNTTRAAEFDKNVGIDYVVTEILKAENVQTLTDLKIKNPVAYNFILSLQNHNGHGGNNYYEYSEATR